MLNVRFYWRLLIFNHQWKKANKQSRKSVLQFEPESLRKFSSASEESFEAFFEILVELVIEQDVGRIGNHVQIVDGVGKQIAKVDLETIHLVVVEIDGEVVEEKGASQLGNTTKQVNDKRHDDHGVGFRFYFTDVSCRVYERVRKID